MHISMVKGDFIFKDWDEESVKAFFDRKKELVADGYKYKETKGDYLNQYYIYEKDGKQVTVTLMCS